MTGWRVHGGGGECAECAAAAAVMAAASAPSARTDGDWRHDGDGECTVAVMAAGGGIQNEGRRFRWTALALAPARILSIARNTTRCAALFGLRRAAREFSLRDRIGPANELQAGNQELRFLGCRM
jgi:hypothetical protein